MWRDDGKKIGEVSNNGRGGSNNFLVYGSACRNLLSKAEEFCKNLPKFVHDEETSLSMNLDFFVSLLVSREIERKRFLRMCKTKIVMIKDLVVYTATFPSGAVNEIACESYQKRYPDVKVLNFLPINEALDLFTDTHYKPLVV